MERLTTRAHAAGGPPSRVADWITLAKVRVNTLVVATTAGGFYMGSRDPLDVMALVLTCAGTALVAGGAAALNQVAERDTDALMERTRTRPLAAARMSVLEGRMVGAVLSLAGLILLWVAISWLAASVALATLVSYVLFYTPLKRHTSFAAVVGAVPGALPPMIGWAASRGSIAELGGWSLFLIMFVWQLPHVLAISWMYRHEYGKAGLPVLPVVDVSGAMTGRQAALWAATLIPISVLPAIAGIASQVYSMGALVLGLAQLAITLRFTLRRTHEHARLVFYASIIYLPLLWIVMTITR
jgi:protoheme IX farnesyltransferase